MGINETLRDDELRLILTSLNCNKDKEGFGLVCKRWLFIQSTERKKLCVRAGPAMLKKMACRFSKVLELDLSHSVNRGFYPGITDSDLDVIANGFDCLKVLNLQDSPGITDVGMVSIANGLSCLQALDVSHCKNKRLSEKGLTAIAKGCCDLRALYVAGCRFISDEFLQNLSSNCSKLEVLGLQGCIKITDSGITSLVTRCHGIKYLDVSKCINVGDAGVLSVSKMCSSHLRTLKLLDCYKVGDDSMHALSKSCKHLETLVIGGCRNISDGSLTLLVNACRESLRCLKMDWCLNISDSSLSFIFSQCRKLEALDIGCCEEVTDAPFQVFGSGDFESNLKVLKIINCPKVTVLGINMLLRSCKKLEYLDVRSCPHITKAGCEEAGLRFPESCKINFMGSLVELDGQTDAYF